MSSTSSVTTTMEAGAFQAAAFGMMLPFDYGDAPESYGTAQHLVSQSVSGTPRSTANPPMLTEAASVYLGSTAPDSESGTGATITTDDTTGVADEGVSQLLANGQTSFPQLAPQQRTYSLPLVCRGEGATVRGWIDTNRNGAFDAAEAASGTCRGGSATLSWTNLPNGIGDASGVYARFRISSAAGDIQLPTGAAADGEVEDYLIPVVTSADLSVIKEQVTQSARAGQPIEYRLTVTNNGPRPATGVTATDTLPTQITGSSGQIDGGPACTVTGQQLSCAIGNLAAGASRTITVKGTVQADAAPGSSFTNTAGVSANEFDQNRDNNTATVTTRLIRPAISIVKTAGSIRDTNGSGRLDAGDTVPYTFKVTNTGDAALNRVTVNDPKITNISCPQATLAPAAEQSCTGNYVLTQDDIDAGKVDNEATASGAPVTGSPVTSTPSKVSTPLNSAPNTMSVTKSAGQPQDQNGDGRPSAGDTIDYTFTVRNTGATTLRSLTITDAKVPGVSCEATSLTPGSTTTCRGTYTISQADMDAGKIVNVATATASGVGGQEVRTASNEVTTPLQQTSSFSFDKSAASPVDSNGNGRIDAGDTIGYSFTFTNTGTTTLRDITVADPLLRGISCPATTLTPGQSVSCTANYTLTQADMDNGKVDNTATGTVTKVDNTTENASSSTSTPLTGVGSLTFDKQQDSPLDSQGNPITGREPGVGDQIPYTFLVTNTGSVTVTGINVLDDKVPAVNCAGTSQLAPGESVTCAGRYTITQADVDSGAVINTAKATGTSPDGQGIESAADSTALTIKQNPAISLTKTAGDITDANNNGKTDAEDVLAYTFTVKNDGNVTVNSVAVADPKVPGITCPATVLAPGESTSCSGTYQLTQADIDAGKVDNTAKASAKAGGSTVTSGEASATKQLPAKDSIYVIKSAAAPVDANNSGRIDAGDTISYSFRVTNSGNTSLTAVAVQDPKIATVQCPASRLGPGRTMTCSGTYTITQDEVDAGKVDNTAIAVGTPPNRPQIKSSPSSTSTPLTPSDSLSVKKDSTGPVDSNNDGRITPGDTVPYTFTVTNTGTTTLTGVRVADPKISDITCAPTTLAPGAQVTCTGQYSITQGDLDAGFVDNTATAYGTPPGRAEISSLPSQKIIQIDQVKALELVKGVSEVTDNNGNGRTDFGDFIQYTFTVTNTGTVSLSSLMIDDPKVGTVRCPQPALAPGETATCTATYSVNQVDVDAGQVVNKATARAQDNSGEAVTSNPSEKTVSTSSFAQINLRKLAAAPNDDDQDQRIDAGDTVEYTFEVKNSGDLTLRNVAVADPLIPSLSCGTASLAPRQIVVCRATYTITQADVDAGQIINNAAVSGVDPRDNTVQAEATATVIIPAQGELDLVKEAGEPRLAEGQDRIGAGSLIDYTFTVTNQTNNTLTDVAIQDDQLAAVTCEGTTLAPQASLICRGTYSLTQEDIDEGQILNLATASAQNPDDSTVTSPVDSAIVTIPQVSTMTLNKTAGQIQSQNDGKLRPGDTIDYSFDVRNTGTTTLYLVGIRDNKVGSVKCPVTVLDPGKNTVCTATYTITQQDLDNGTLDNTASAVGTPPSGEEITSPESTATVSTKAESGLSLQKQAGDPIDANGNNRIDPGDTINYTFTARNTGQTTLKDLAITDVKVPSVSCPVQSLAPGASVRCTATLVLTQADIDAGKVDNTATASTTNPYGEQVTSNESSASVTIAQQNMISLIKATGQWQDANNNGRMDVGERIPYTFEVTNKGTTTLTSVRVVDSHIPSISCPVNTLAPGEKTTCTGEYALTQDDIDDGELLNSATAIGAAPNGTEVVSPGSQVVTEIKGTSELSFDKQAGAIVDANNNGRVDAGDTIDYTFVLSNTGTVSLDNLQIEDPKLGVVTCPQDLLAGGQSMVCAKTYTITQEDLDNGSAQNDALAKGENPQGTEITSNEDSTSTPLQTEARLRLVKTAADPVDANDSGRVDAGDTITYTFAVLNEGTATMQALRINDSKLPAVECPVTTVLPGQEVTCRDVYTITQVDMDAGQVENSATATGTPRNTVVAVTSGPSSTNTPLNRAASVTLAKTADDPQDANNSGRVDAGDTVTYRFTVTNTGTTTVSSFQINDPMFPADALSCETGSLAPGAQAICTATYTLTQADADQGSVHNIATVTGTTPAGEATSPPAEADTEIPAVNSLAIIKSVVAQADEKKYRDENGNGRPDAGERIDYRFVVTNTGNTTQHTLAVDDPRVADVSCPFTELPAGESVTCTASYALSQADIDAGQVENQATVTGTAPDGQATEAQSENIVTALERQSALSLRKEIAAVDDVNTNQLTDAGDVISYRFIVSNTGNTTLKDAAVSDAKLSEAGSVNCPVTEIGPGQRIECTGSYTITQDEVDTGAVKNTAQATGTGSDGKEVSAESTAIQPTAATTGLNLVKKIADDSAAPAKAGDTIRYIFTLTNTGTLSIASPRVQDKLPITVSCPDGPILPGQSLDCSGSYAVTQAEVDRGEVQNQATATGTAPNPGGDGTQTVTSGIAGVDQPILRNNQLGLVKTVDQVEDVNGNGKNDAGDRVTYRLVAENQGNTTLTGVTVRDALLPELQCSADTLAPGQKLECTGTYTLTQADVDNGSVTNKASASGTGPDGAAPKSGEQRITTVTSTEAALTMQKSYEAPPVIRMVTGRSMRGSK